MRAVSSASQPHYQPHPGPSSLLQLLLCLCSLLFILLLSLSRLDRQAPQPVQRNWLKNLLTRSHTRAPTVTRAADGPSIGRQDVGAGMVAMRAISLLGCAQNPSRYEQTLLNHNANKRTSFVFGFPNEKRLCKPALFKSLCQRQTLSSHPSSPHA